MSNRKAVDRELWRDVVARDGGKCVKCRRRRRLEVHHIVPVYKGGPDLESNLITLCKPCHDEAPDSPVDFVHWAVSGLPPSMDASKRMTTICLTILFAEEGLGAKVEQALKLVDEIYADLWRLQRSVNEDGETGWEAFGDHFGSFIRKYVPGSSADKAATGSDMKVAGSPNPVQRRVKSS